MKKYLLSSWLKISGIIAASSIAYQNNELVIISDNSNAIYTYFIKNDSLTSLLVEGSNLNDTLDKKVKFDLESLYVTNDTIFTFGSGSKLNRSKGFLQIPSSNMVQTIDLTYLYQEMKQFSSLDDKNFNIEGVTKYKNEWIFLNRGNGPKKANYLFFVQGKNLTDEFNLFYYKFKLPNINNAASGFSDGYVLNNTLYFIATAEDEASTYHDGEIKGTLFGAIDLKKMKLLYTEKISDTNKFEGLSLMENNNKELIFALCEDPDNSQLKEGVIYKLKIDLKKKTK